MLSDEEIKTRVSALTAELVRIPSQAGIDDVQKILTFVESKLWEKGLGPQRLMNQGSEAVGVYAHVPPPAWAIAQLTGYRRPQPPGPTLCLDACLDTAPVGDENSWRPNRWFSGTEEGGKLFGRGVADSKVGCALFLTLAEDLWQDDAIKRGRLDVLFDADEHTGQFGGVKAYIEAAGKPQAVAIGYPGNDQIKVGARGFLRAVIITYGRAEHSGRRANDAQNAIYKMLRVVARLRRASLPPEPDLDFSFGPKLSVTAISGGNGFSQIPDRCKCHVDVRLTPHFVAEDAKAILAGIVRRVDEDDPGPRPSEIDWPEDWPPYKLERSDPLVRSLGEAAARHFSRPIPMSVSGASNIGNYLASLDVPAICGFGVSYENIHAADESISVDTVVPTYKTYRDAVLDYFEKSPA